MAINVAEHKIVNLLKTLLSCSSVFISVCVFNVWPKTALPRPVWRRDAKRLHTPAGFTTLSLLLHLRGFLKQHSPPQPHWASAVARNRHDLFHFISSAMTALFYFPSVFPFLALLENPPFLQCRPPSPPPCSQRSSHMALGCFWHYIAVARSHQSSYVDAQIPAKKQVVTSLPNWLKNHRLTV